MLHVICTRLRPGHLSVLVGDSSRLCEEIVKKISNSAFECDYYYYYYYYGLQLDEILSDLEEHKELAANRLLELEKLTADHQEALKEIEKLKMDVSLLSLTIFDYF